MSKRRYQSDGELVAEGEVEGVGFQVLRYLTDKGVDYRWRTLKEGKIIGACELPFDSVDSAIADVMMKLAPDAIPVEYTEPTAHDFEALNALLYTGGLQSELTTFQEVVLMYTGFQEGLPVMLAGRDKMAHDLDQLTSDMKAIRGAMSDRVQNIIKMKEVVMVQYDILETITQRNLETLFSFIDQFLKK